MSVWYKLRRVIRNNLPITIVIIAAVLLELTMATMYYSAQSIIRNTMQKLVEREMDAIFLSICNKFTEVEVTLDNMAWAVSDDLVHPDSLLRATYQLIEHNPSILGSSATCIPYFFPQKGRWYEAYSVRREDGTIESMQLGSADHDYTKMEFYKVPIANGSGHWTLPYLDDDGAMGKIITYGVPVRNGKGDIVAVFDADIPYDWLVDLLDDEKNYESTQRFLVSGSGKLVAGEDNEVLHRVLEMMADDEDNQGYEEFEDGHGENMHAFFHPIGGKTDWVLISVLNDSEVFGKLLQVRITLLSLVVMGLLLMGFVIYRTSRDQEHLQEVNAEKERIGGELLVASQIQQSMLPNHHYCQDDVEIDGSLVPAREIGGDLYDYYIRDEKLFFCIGDVSGKGAPAAMVMSAVHTLFRAISAREDNPASMMQSINETFCHNSENNLFVTLFIGVLDLPTGHLCYCNAGHDTPIVLEEGKICSVCANPHLPVGVFDDVKYEVQEIQIKPDSTIFLYTDGLTEARNAARKMFGRGRVETILEQCTALCPKDILTRVTDAVHNYVMDAEQSDDLTLLAIHYTPSV